MPDPCLLITRQKGCADGGAVARYQISDIRYDIRHSGVCGYVGGEQSLDHF
jgi:hypothetical protein